MNAEIFKARHNIKPKLLAKISRLDEYILRSLLLLLLCMAFVEQEPQLLNVLHWHI